VRMLALAVSCRWSAASALVVAAVALGCAAKSSDAPAEAADSDDGSEVSGSGGSGGDDAANLASRFEVCPGPLGAPEDLEATPRADENLELLALVLEPDQVVASQANYERVVADVAAIRELAPELASIEYRPMHDAQSVRVTFNDAGMDALSMNAFGAWGCLNDALGATVGSVVDVFPVYAPLLQLRGVHNMLRVEQLYEQLPGIADAEIYGADADGPTWCIGREGARYEYVIDSASGGCSSGCREHEARHFSSEAAGAAISLEIWRSGDGAAAPDWFSRLCAAAGD
jgi:hypothetical protein